MTAFAAKASAKTGIARFASQEMSPLVREWIEQCAALCQPQEIHVCDGSAAQRKQLLDRAVAEGVLIPLSQEKLPGCYLHRSHPNDAACTEESTFIGMPSEQMAGPSNRWMEATAAKEKLTELFQGCMKGRTMYVVPFVMGPIGCPLAKVGIQLTDSLYVAVSMGILTRMGSVAWKPLGDGEPFTRCLHSLGDGEGQRRCVCHWPLDNTIWSFGSGYGGNALLSKEALGLRIASFLGSQEGWLAEHMLIAGVTILGHKDYVAAAFPSTCGKTNFAMLVPPERYRKAGWKVTTVGDDIAWMWVDEETGKLRAINPESGYFGVLPGTNWQSNPNAMETMSRNSIYTNVALLPDGDVWWEGKTAEPPKEAIDWMGKAWTPGCGRPAAHPNGRFTAPMANNPVLDPAADDPKGVAISAIIFGGRRSKTVPLVYQAFNWMHGVYIGATLGSETAAASAQDAGVVHRDPMAMLPFVGYNIGEYLIHWFRMRKKLRDCPRIFHVNWFRTNEQGKFIWPGFAENIRILRWILDRCHGRAYGVETPLGWMPRVEDIDLGGLDLLREELVAVQHVDLEAFKSEIVGQEELFLKLAEDLPKEMIFQRELLISRL
ncbi:MAG: phosphoenolpyruvate carboxykinase (GTP) [Tepidisphaeraceae bacterium]|jgi:phosphoenolpyruvate carboxykinase (GTP)